MRPAARVPALLGRLFFLWQHGGRWRWVDEDGRGHARAITIEQFGYLARCIRSEFADETARETGDEECQWT